MPGGAWLLLQLDLQSGGSTPPPDATDLRMAVYDALLRDSGVAAVCGARIFPGYRPQSGVMPAATYRVIDLPRVLDLDGQAGLGMARVEIACWASLLTDARATAEAVRLAFGRAGLAGSLAGLAAPVVAPLAERDDFDDPQDGTDQRPRSITLTWQIHYRESRP